MDTKVWLSSRKTRKGVTYHMRWQDPCTAGWKSRAACTNKKASEKMAGRLEDQLNSGTFREVKRTTWGQFVDRAASCALHRTPAKACPIVAVDSYPGQRTVRRRAGSEVSAFEAHQQLVP